MCEGERLSNTDSPRNGNRLPDVGRRFCFSGVLMRSPITRTQHERHAPLGPVRPGQRKPPPLEQPRHLVVPLHPAPPGFHQTAPEALAGHARGIPCPATRRSIPGPSGLPAARSSNREVRMTCNQAADMSRFSSGCSSRRRVVRPRRGRGFAASEAARVVGEESALCPVLDGQAFDAVEVANVESD